MKSRRILVVDDNKDGCRMLRMLLASFGHVVEACYTGCDAVEHIHRFQPDVVLLDIGLPCLNGWEVAKTLREGGDDATKIYALTGYSEQADLARSVQAGMNRHFIKPLDLENLWSAMRQDLPE